jgi:hypothetical protein
MQGNIVAAARWICAGMVFSTLLLVGGLLAATFGSTLLPGQSGCEPTQPVATGVGPLIGSAPAVYAPTAVPSTQPPPPYPVPVAEAPPAPTQQY